MKSGTLPGDRPLVTVIIPTRNEEKHIGRCLDSILENDYPVSRLEILAVDGRSSDRTREIVGEYARKHGCIRLLDNPDRITPHALNLGVKDAKGDIILTVGAHTTYSDNYISTIARLLGEGKADCVGSVAEMLPANDTLISHAISMASSYGFGVGNSRMKTGVRTGRYVDTASCPGYKKEVFEKTGLFDETLIRGQDHELNCRVRRAGGKIYLSPEITSYYSCRRTLNDLARGGFRTGMWNVKKIQRNPDAFAPRHWMPFGFVAMLLLLSVLSLLWVPLLYVAAAILVLYFAANMGASLSLAAKNGVQYLPILLVVFTVVHFSYGLGTVVGFFAFGVPAPALVRSFYRWSRSSRQ